MENDALIVYLGKYKIIFDKQTKICKPLSKQYKLLQLKITPKILFRYARLRKQLRTSNIELQCMLNRNSKLDGVASVVFEYEINKQNLN